MCVFSTFFVALSIFPGLTTSLQSSTGLGSWYPILLVGSYNLGECLPQRNPAIRACCYCCCCCCCCLCAPRGRRSDHLPLLEPPLACAGDLFGKSAPSRVRLVNSTTLPLCALAHTCFVPALLLLSHPAYLPPMLGAFAPLLRTDAFACAVVFKLGVSTGYIGCMSLVLGTERAETPEEKEGAGLFTSFALMMGLAAGSSCGLLLEKLA